MNDKTALDYPDIGEENSRAPSDLLKRIVTLSLETMKIMKGFP